MSDSRITDIVGRAIVLTGDDIDTDRIMPARFLKAVTFNGIERHVFEDDRAAAAAAGTLHPFSNLNAAGATILIAGSNFGCGSSREHAPQALVRLGLRAIVAESFAEIFFSNAHAIGLPCLRISRTDAAALKQACQADAAAEIAVSLENLSVSVGADRFSLEMPAGIQHSFLTGHWDATGLLVADEADVTRVAQALPYIRGF